MIWRALHHGAYGLSREPVAPRFGRYPRRTCRTVRGRSLQEPSAFRARHAIEDSRTPRPVLRRGVEDLGRVAVLRGGSRSPRPPGTCYRTGRNVAVKLDRE